MAYLSNKYTKNKLSFTNICLAWHKDNIMWHPVGRGFTVLYRNKCQGVSWSGERVLRCQHSKQMYLGWLPADCFVSVEFIEKVVGHTSNTTRHFT